MTVPRNNADTPEDGHPPENSPGKDCNTSELHEPAGSEDAEGFNDFGLTPRPRVRKPAEFTDPYLNADLGGIRVVRFIAEGGMGRVYEGTQDRPNRPVAIKLMRLGHYSAESARRFQNEWELLGKLRHPHIAQIYTAGVHNFLGLPVPFFVMEYLPDAVPITEFAETRQLSTKERLALFSKACEAVAHGHSQGILHRDLKPSNILVEPSGHLKVIDFGVARNVNHDPDHVTQLTHIGQLIGTVQYMSPEQFSADPSAIDLRSDVYALGVILYELLTGIPPYEIRQKHIFEAARVVRESNPTPPEKLNAQLPPGVGRITCRCLEKDRGQRFASAAALVDAIEACTKTNGVDTVRPQPRRWPAIAGVAACFFALLAIAAYVQKTPTPVPTPKPSPSPPPVQRPFEGLIATITAKIKERSGSESVGWALESLREIDSGSLDAAVRGNIDTALGTLADKLSSPSGSLLPEDLKRAFDSIAKIDTATLSPNSVSAVDKVRIALSRLSDSLSGKSAPAAIETSLPRMQAAPSSPTARNEVFLSDLSPIVTQIGFGELPPAGERGEGNKLFVRGVESPHGIFSHPPSNGCSRLTYVLPAGSERLRTSVAIADSSERETITPLTFLVRDEKGVELWRCPEPLKSKVPLVPCDISVQGHSEITLEVSCPGDYHSAHAAWVEPTIVVGSSTTDATDVTAIPAEAVLWQDHAYYFFPEMATQDRAAARCVNMGGYLARIESAEENRLVVEAYEALRANEFLTADARYWINGTDRVQEGEWKFLDGSQMHFFGWRKGEPNSEAEDEDGLQLMGGGWNDISLGRKYGFICEWDRQADEGNRTVEIAVAEAVEAWSQRRERELARRIPPSERDLPETLDIANLNDPRNWIIDSGSWRVTKDGRLRGEGDSMIHLRRKIPWPAELSFQMQVPSGMRPRVHLGGSDIYFGNEGYDRTIWLYGQGVQDPSGKPFPYQNNVTYAVKVLTADDRITLFVDGKEVGRTGNPKKPTELQLALQGGDGWSPGATEFWDFRVMDDSDPQKSAIP